MDSTQDLNSKPIVGLTLRCLLETAFSATPKIHSSSFWEYNFAFELLAYSSCHPLSIHRRTSHCVDGAEGGDRPLQISTPEALGQPPILSSSFLLTYITHETGTLRDNLPSIPFFNIPPTTPGISSPKQLSLDMFFSLSTKHIPLFH